jgi:predicted RNA-binding protein Jag
MKSIIEQASSIMKAIEKAWNQAEQPKEFSIKIFEKEERNFFGMTTKPAKIGIFFGDKFIIHEKPQPKPRPEIKECRPVVAKATADTMSGTPVTAPHSSGRPVHKASMETSEGTARLQRPSKPVSDTSSDTSREAINSSEMARASQEARKPTDKTNSVGPHQNQHAARPKNQPKTVQQQPRTASEKTPIVDTIKEEKPRRPAAVWSEPVINSVHEWLKNTLELMNLGAITFDSQVVGRNLKLTFNMPLAADPFREKQIFRSFAHLILSSLRNQYKQEIKDLKVILLRAE